MKQLCSSEDEEPIAQFKVTCWNRPLASSTDSPTTSPPCRRGGLPSSLPTGHAADATVAQYNMAVVKVAI